MSLNDQLAKAVINNLATEAQQLINQGANAQYCPESDEQFSLLHLAALYNADSVVPILLAAGANVNRKSANDGVTALDIAKQYQHRAIVLLLQDQQHQATTQD